jgi:pimeloyl-CoA synthetase
MLFLNLFFSKYNCKKYHNTKHTLNQKKKKEHVTTSQIKQSMEFLTWFKRFRGKRIMPRNLKLGENRRKTIKIN